MGGQVRDAGQMNAFTGLSHAQVDSLLPVCSAIDQATPQHRDAAGRRSGTRRRKPGGGTQGQWPTMAETRRFVLDDDQTSPTFDGLGTPVEIGRSKADEHLQKRSPLVDATLVHVEMMPPRECGTPDDLKAALQGMDQRIMDATERTSRRAPDEAKHRAHDRGKKSADAEAYGHGLA